MFKKLNNFLRRYSGTACNYLRDVVSHSHDIKSYYVGNIISDFIMKRFSYNLLERLPHMDDIKMDPCTIQSIWRGGDYINARMLVQGQDQSHIVAFIDKGIEDRETGYKQLTLYLHHDQNGDTEAFTRIVYLSCPLRGYADDLVKGRDSVAFVVNQEGEGLTTFMLPY